MVTQKGIDLEHDTEAPLIQLIILLTAVNTGILNLEAMNSTMTLRYLKSCTSLILNPPYTEYLSTKPEYKWCSSSVRHMDHLNPVPALRFLANPRSCIPKLVHHKYTKDRGYITVFSFTSSLHEYQLIMKKPADKDCQRLC
nr:hypothetical protein Itr_chr03CG19450 [Ipomoea trifida]